MAAQGVSRAQEIVFNHHGAYCCSHCGRPLQLEMVVTADVERRNGSATGYVTFDHYCPCTPRDLRTSRGWGSYPSFLALFGRQPSLPYRASFAWSGISEDDGTVARWRWELDQVADGADFLLFANEAAGQCVPAPNEIG